MIKMIANPLNSTSVLFKNFFLESDGAPLKMPHYILKIIIENFNTIDPLY